MYALLSFCSGLHQTTIDYLNVRLRLLEPAGVLVDKPPLPFLESDGQFLTPFYSHVFIG